MRPQNFSDIDVLVPDPLQSDRQYARSYHLDLPELGDTELKNELYALRPLLWGLPSEHWLRERVKAIESEISKRRGNAGHKFRGQSKPKLAEGVQL
jgi:predicted nucleotidyltransferase